MIRPRILWATSALVLALVLTGSLVAFRRDAAPTAHPQQGDPLIVQRTKGLVTAPLTVYELSDFQCPFCRRQALETFPVLEQEFIATGKVRWIFLNFPISSIHPNAIAAAELSLCAARVDHFWPIHDLLFTYQSKWAPLKDPAPFLLSLADSAGIPRDDMVGCLQNHDMLELAKAEAEGAAKSGVASTPTVYIEGAGLITGAQPVAIYREILDSLWKERTTGE
ncbi:MAG: thioredoxin domain-containing protein [Gemmatimonadales bacterium]